MSDPLDDTSVDYEQLETELLAQDRDAASGATADLAEATARHLVSEFVDADIVTPVPEDRVPVHEPVHRLRLNHPVGRLLLGLDDSSRRRRGGE